MSARQYSKRSGGKPWECPACGSNFAIRRCANCLKVGSVSAAHRKGQPWTCVWCQEPNYGFVRRNDPAEATIADLVSDTQAGLPDAGEATSAPAGAYPMLIVTINEIPGYRITKVHGDVFGLVVRAELLQQSRCVAADSGRRRGLRIHQTANRQQEPGPCQDVGASSCSRRQCRRRDALRLQ